jgi:DNA (cytosine-5)-methyltransferase 1
MTYATYISYQFTLGVLDSRAFGSPQNRLRLWIIAARRGVTLPKFPHPTHANPHPRNTIISVDGKEVNTFYADNDGISTPGTGVYPPITVKDAISDLPGEFGIVA